MESKDCSFLSTLQAASALSSCLRGSWTGGRGKAAHPGHPVRFAWFSIGGGSPGLSCCRASELVEYEAILSLKCDFQCLSLTHALLGLNDKGLT